MAGEGRSPCEGKLMALSKIENGKRIAPNREVFPRRPRVTASPAVTGGTLGGVKFEVPEVKLAIEEQKARIPEKVQKTELDLVLDLDEFIDRADTLLGMYLESGGFKGMGPTTIRGRNIPIVSSIARQYGEDKERFNEFFTENETAFQKLRKAITGAQASFQELQALRPLVPSTSDVPSVYLAKLMAARESSRRIRDKRLKRLEQAGRITEGFIDPKAETDHAKVGFFRALVSTGFDRERAADLVQDNFSGFDLSRAVLPRRRDGS